MDDNDAVLLLLQALEEVSKRGIRVADLHRQARRAAAAGVMPVWKVAKDDARLVRVVGNLVGTGLVTLSEDGLRLTAGGLERAHSLRAAAGPQVSRGIASAARDVA